MPTLLKPPKKKPGPKFGARFKNKGVKKLAKALGVSPQTITRKLNRGETEASIRAASAAKGKGVVGKVARILDDTEDEQQDEGLGFMNVEGADPAVLESTVKARQRYEIAKADERELRVAELRGELANVGVLNQWFGNCIIAARDKMMLIPDEMKDRMAATGDPLICAQLMREKIVAALKELKLYDGRS